LKKGLRGIYKKKLWYGTVISRLDRCAGRARAPDAERFVATGSAGDKYTGKRPALLCRGRRLYGVMPTRVPRYRFTHGAEEDAVGKRRGGRRSDPVAGQVDHVGAHRCCSLRTVAARNGTVRRAGR
jgi:hypothetical protein